MSLDVHTWWLLLCAVSVLNIAAWAGSAVLLQRRRGLLPDDAYRLRRLLLLLSAGYVLGCGFRSVLPVYDVPRQVLFDTWLSSVLVGRSVATLAELCFAAQWALLLHEASHRTGSPLGRHTALWIVPLIALAETCSWYAVLTTSNLGHILEESLWGLSAALLVASVVTIWPRCTPKQRPLLAAWCLVGVAYVAFMFLVDVPMYWSRWLADEASGRQYLSLQQGWLDVSARWVVATGWEQWRSEVVWMSLYFSVAVWLSIAMVHAPVARRRVPIAA